MPGGPCGQSLHEAALALSTGTLIRHVRQSDAGRGPLVPRVHDRSRLLCARGAAQSLLSASLAGVRAVIAKRSFRWLWWMEIFLMSKNLLTLLIAIPIHGLCAILCAEASA